MTETKEYAGMLYSIADEIEVEGRVTKACAELNGWTPERIRDAAQRMDEIDAVRKQRDEVFSVFSILIDEMDKRHHSDGNAPGHAHEIPGVWDRDNGPMAGKPCAWCAVWNKAKELRAAIASVKGGAA